MRERVLRFGRLTVRIELRKGRLDSDEKVVATFYKGGRRLVSLHAEVKSLLKADVDRDRLSRIARNLGIGEAVMDRVVFEMLKVAWGRRGRYPWILRSHP